MTTVNTINVDSLDQYYKNPNYVIIDLRSPEEYAKGHLKGAINIPYENLTEYGEFPQNKTLILYCERGNTSLFTARELMKKGYQTKSVVGGFRAYRGSNLEF
jgi:thiosulfate sulfurtransferase